MQIIGRHMRRGPVFVELDHSRNRPTAGKVDLLSPSAAHRPVRLSDQLVKIKVFMTQTQNLQMILKLLLRRNLMRD